MRHLFNVLYRELLKTVVRPKRILKITNKNRMRTYLNDIGLRLRLKESWIPHDSDQAFSRRVYRTYEDYVAHQRSKLEHIDLTDYDIKYRVILRERLEKLNLLHCGMNVLCLAARIGTEVKAFLDIGCFAIGIDLNPGENNRYVLHGDFHNLQFPSNSVDVVFTNALDHTINIKQLIKEIKRVSKPNSLLIVEAGRGSSEGKSPGYYESFFWSKIDDLVHLFENSQYKLIKRSSFDYPWDGEQLCLRKEK